MKYRFSKSKATEYLQCPKRLSARAGSLLFTGASFGGGGHDSGSPGKRLVIGIGGAGASIVRTIRTLPEFSHANCQTIAVDWDDCCDGSVSKSLVDFHDRERIMLGSRLDLSPPYPGGPWGTTIIKQMLMNDVVPEAMALFEPIIGDAQNLVVVAGLGGATGSFMGINLVKMSLKSGIPTLSVWTTPFKFEGDRVAFSQWLIGQGYTHQSACQILPNEDLLNELGGRVTLKQAYFHVSLKASRLIMAHLADHGRNPPGSSKPA